MDNNTNNGSSGSGTPGMGEQLSRTNLYIRGLPPHTTDKDLLLMCGNYGNIISTKAILDKNTNKCKGYGFVDFESPYAAESAVKALQAQGVQAQMAKCTDTSRSKHAVQSSIVQTAAFNAAAAAAYSSCPFTMGRLPQQEQDPTNLYIANLPPYMAEAELEAMLQPYGTVISTRILRDGNHQPRGVGFARMDAKDKCDLIIQAFNGKALVGCKEPLLVKFADGGNKKKSASRGWRDMGGGDQMQLPTDHTGMGQNGVTAQFMPATMAAAAAAQYAGQAAAAARYNQTAQLQTASYPPSATNGFQARQYSNAAAAAAAAGQLQSQGYGNHPVARYQSTRPYSATSPLQPNSYQAAATAAALQASTHPWVHPAAAASGQPYLVQSPAAHMQPMPSQAMALHLSALMPQISAQMSQLSLGGAAYHPQYVSGPGTYPPAPSALYAAQGTPLIQQMAMNGSNGGTDVQGGSGSSSIGPQDDLGNNKGQQNTQASQQSYVVCSQSK